MVRFPNVSPAEANRAASSLAEALRNVDPHIVAEPTREQPDTQDFGTTLVLILGTASANALAKGISSWIARHGTRIEISRDGHVLATGLDSQDVAKIVEALRGTDLQC